MLFSQMEPPEELEEEFNDWYDTEHIPVRLALPGFSKATRYIERDRNRRYLAIYEIDDLNVLESPGYKALKTSPSRRTAQMLKSVRGFTRFTCSAINDTGGPEQASAYLSGIASMQLPESANNFDEVHTTRHELAAPNCQRIRYYKVLSADGGALEHIQPLRSSLLTASAFSQESFQSWRPSDGFGFRSHWSLALQSALRPP